MKEAFENTEMNPREKLKVTKADIIVTGTKRNLTLKLNTKKSAKKTITLDLVLMI